MSATADLQRWLTRVGPGEVLDAVSQLVSDAALVIVDDQRRVLLWGGDAERLLGWRRDEVVGGPCPNGVVCGGDGNPREFGARVRVTRADGNEVAIRHLSRIFAGPTGARMGAVHLLVPDRDLPAAETAEAVEFQGILSCEPAMLRVFQTVRNVAETDATVLVRGESGTGKELVARALHREGHRRDGPFVAVNCASFAPMLLESELFGHKKGAFTGATHDRDGIFAQAKGGTLFLDEVAEIPLDLQSKLLRVLQERVFVPVGGTKPIMADVRVVAATHKALREEAKAGRFREDLLYRLRVVPIFLPALRERPADIEPLLLRLIAHHSARGPRRIRTIRPEALAALKAYAWPGNVRELQNVVEYAFAVGRGAELTSEDLPPEVVDAPPQKPTAPSASAGLDEAGTIRAAIAAAGGDLALAAEKLGMSRTTFWRRRQKLGI